MTATAQVTRALVLGASGHVGNAVVRELLARGAAVTAARRGRTAAHNLAGLAVREAIGDASDAATLDGWIADHDLVIDAAAPYPLHLAERTAGASSARRAALLADTVAHRRVRLVHVGSFVTRQPARGPGELHPYFAAKRAGERVLTAAARSGAPITIVHPTACLGPWDSRPEAMCLIPRVLAGWVPAAPAQLINVIDVRDVARGIAAAATAGLAAGEPLALSGHDVGVAELCALIAELAGTTVATRAIPASLAHAGAWAIELATFGAAMPPVLLPLVLALRQAPIPVSAAQRALGASPRPLSATLRDAIAWYRTRGSGTPARAVV